MGPIAPRPVLKSLVLVLVLGALAGARNWMLEGFVSSGTSWGQWEPRASWSVHGLAQLDQMVAGGFGFGYEAVPTRPVGLADARLQVRLPLGRQVLPFLDAEAGVGIRPMLEDSYPIWKLGGGLDVKLGDRSSLLAGAGAAAVGRWYGRLGLLLEL